MFPKCNQETGTNATDGTAIALTGLSGIFLKEEWELPQIYGEKASKRKNRRD
jgi:hypothetical protein